MSADLLFPELECSSDREELLSRFGGDSHLAFAEVLAHDAHTLPAHVERDSVLESLIVPALDARREGHFHSFLLPLALPGLHKIHRKVGEHGLDPEIVVQTGVSILGALIDIALRTLVTSMHEASKAGKLAGDTPHRRYDEYQRILSTATEQRRIVEKHPLLIPTLRHAATRSAENVLRLLDDLHEDTPDLMESGFLTGPVVRVELDAGDTHAGGRSVAILECADGNRLVYKPRSLRIDVAYNRFLAIVNKLAATSLDSVPTLDRGDHGWTQFLTSARPTSLQGEDRYFRQTGQLLAVAHLLGAADLHQENILCHNGGPVIVDLETILHPRLRTSAVDVSRHTVMDDLMQGVNAVGLLPYHMVNGDDGIDISATGFADDALSPFKSLVVRHAGRDDMFVALENAAMPVTAGAVSIPSDVPRTVDLCEQIQQGFEQVYRAVLAEKDSVASQLPEIFAGARVRILVNPTVVYCQLLRLVTQPWFFKPGRQRIQGLQRVALWGNADLPVLSRAEFRDLARGDVPLLTAEVTSTVLHDADGQVVGDYLAESPLDAALRRIGGMSDQGLRTQVRRISSVLVHKFPDSFQRTPVRPGMRRSLRDHTQDALALAKRIGDDLLTRQLDGVTPSSPANWIGPRMDHDVRGWHPNVLEVNLYAGILGPAMFLAHLGAVTESRRYIYGAERILNPVSALLLSGELVVSDDPTPRTGVFSGLAGSHLALGWSGSVLGRSDLTSSAIRSLDALIDSVPSDTALDFLDGSAGFIHLAAVLKGLASSDEEHRQIRRLAEAAHGRLTDSKSAGHLATALNYSGFAHGAAGIRSAIHRAAEAFALPDVSGVADAALEATRSLYMPESGAYSASVGAGGSSLGWCHGLLGIALGHTLEAQGQRVGEAERDMRRAAQAIIRQGFGNDFSYCHGDVGNLEILSRIATALDDPALQKEADGLAGHLLCDVLPKAAFDLRNRNAHSPSLLIGSSGIGWYALRSVAPDVVPDPLSLR